MTTNTPQDPQAETPPKDAPPTEAKNTESVNNEHMIPKTRLDEEIQKRRDLEQRLENLEKAEKKAAEERLKKNGEFEKLSEQLQNELTEALAKASKADEYSAIIAADLLARIAEIPEDKRALVENLPASMSDAEKLAWINANKALLTVTPASGDWGAGKRGGGGGKTVPQVTPELSNAGANFGLTKEQQENVAKRLAERKNNA